MESVDGDRMLDYVKKVSGRALAANLETLGWEKGGADWVKIWLSGLALFIASILGVSAMALGLWLVGAVLLFGCVLALTLLFLWKVVVIAYEMDENLRAELEASQTTTRHFNEVVARKLYALLKQGNELIGSRAVSEKRLSENVWVEDLVSWCAGAQDLVAKNLPRSDAMGFMTISVFPTVDHSRPELENILQARLQNLRQIAVRYMEFAPG